MRRTALYLITSLLLASTLSACCWGPGYYRGGGYGWHGGPHYYYR